MRNGFSCFVLGLVLCVCGCVCPSSGEGEAKPVSIALYAYVPDRAVFEKAISEAWSKKHPGIPVVFTE